MNFKRVLTPETIMMTIAAILIVVSLTACGGAKWIRSFTTTAIMEYGLTR